MQGPSPILGIDNHLLASSTSIFPPRQEPNFPFPQAARAHSSIMHLIFTFSKPMQRMRKNYLVLLAVTSTLFFSCRKDPNNPALPTSVAPILITTTPSNITASSTVSGGRQIQNWNEVERLYTLFLDGNFDAVIVF